MPWKLSCYYIYFKGCVRKDRLDFRKSVISYIVPFKCYRFPILRHILFIVHVKKGNKAHYIINTLI